jgi:hypothetical protein
MAFENSSKYLQSHPYRRRASTPTIFTESGNLPCFSAFLLRWRIVAMAPEPQMWEFGTANPEVVDQMRFFRRPALPMRFDDGHERHHRISALGRTLGRG